MWKLRFAAPAAIILAVTSPTSASANADEIEFLKRENAQMKEMLMQMQKQLQDVIMKTNAMQQQAEEAAEKSGEEKAGMVQSRKEGITISTTGGGIQVKSSNGNAFKIGGRLMLDHDSYDDFWEEDAEENEIRRSRITLSGNSGKNWSYKFTTNIDHEDSEASVDTGYIKYSSQPMYVQLGKFKRPAMLEERTSSKWISTIEHSILKELSTPLLGKPSFGGIGVGYASKGDMPISAAIGIFDDEIDEAGGDDVYGLGARITLVPKIDEDTFVHAGASFYSVDYKGNPFRARSRMGVHTAGRPFDTGEHETNDIDQFGLEAAFVSGPFSLQGEMMDIESDGTDNTACSIGTISDSTPTLTCDMEMDGFYAQAAYTLTGEQRGYKSDSGAFAAIKPKDELGAWEIVARYEDMDVDIPGRSLSAELERMVLGLNWYVNENVKFMLNYVDAEMDGSCESTQTHQAAQGGSVPVDSGETFEFGNFGYAPDGCKDDGQAISLRGQYVF